MKNSKSQKTTSDPCAAPGDEFAVQGTTDAEKRRKGIRTSKNSRWRAATLIFVHVVLIAHISQWLLTGKTLSPIEPSESMSTLELGYVNAGFVFFILSILATVIFGRFFCGWGCHLVALQDLCAWVMKRVGIRPRMFRTRFLFYAPWAVALMMFVWPSFKRVILLPLTANYVPEIYRALKPVPEFPGFTNHLITEEFWATFAAWEAIPFLFVCGFATVYFLGSKGFCTFGCPYGAFYGLADRFAVGQIRADLSSCEKCGHCTSTCTSGVTVHKEIQVWGKVVSSACFKCLDCVSVCPTKTLSYGRHKPAAWSKMRLGKQRVRKIYDATFGEELLLVVVGLTVFWSLRGIYDHIPMLMAVGLAGCITFLTWKFMRLFKDRDVSLHGYEFKQEGKLGGAGLIFASSFVLLSVFCIHSAVVKIEIARADASDRRVVVPESVVLATTDLDLSQRLRRDNDNAIVHYSRADSFSEGGWALGSHSHIVDRLAWLHLVRGDADKALHYLRRATNLHGPSDDGSYYTARILLEKGEDQDALELLSNSVAENPNFERSIDLLVDLHLSGGRFIEAKKLAESVMRDGSISQRRVARVAHVLEASGRGIEIVGLLQRSIDDHPDVPGLRVLLARRYSAENRAEEARSFYRSEIEQWGLNESLALELASLLPLQEADRFLRNTLQEFPHYHGVREQLTTLMRDPDEIMSARLAAVQRYPGNVRYRQQLAAAYLNSSLPDLKAALGELRHALRLAPWKWDIHRQLGMTLFYAAADRDGGLASMAEAVELAPGNQALVREFEEMKRN